MSRPIVDETYNGYQARRYFTALDGLRAVSILLVVSLHTTDAVWRRLHGSVGVTIFFVISGYLITTLLLREEGRRRDARIRAFYVRRAFRILPLYFVTLLGYVVIIGLLHLQAGAADLWRSLPWYLTYQNDFAPSGSGFGHTWSLAVEEKFYLLWPLTFCVLAFRRHRLAIAAGLGLLFTLASLSNTTEYLATYAPILFGCCVALILDRPSLYTHAKRLATTPVAILLLVGMTVQVLMFENDTHVHVVFAAMTAMLLPAVLIGPRWLSAVLSNRVATYVGTRAYAVYLIHRMAKGLVDKVIDPGGSVPHQLTRFTLIVGLALLGAEILCRYIEQPMIGLGKRMASGRFDTLVAGGPSGPNSAPRTSRSTTRPRPPAPVAVLGAQQRTP